MSAVVWSKRDCPQCEQAKQLLKQSGVPFEVRTIDGQQWTREQLLSVAPAARSVPQIFLDEEYVGGVNELKEKLKG